MAIQNKEFFTREPLLAAVEHAKKNNSSLNLVGLLTEGHVHASFDHLEALLQCAKDQGLKRVNLHLFADGKDSRPHSLATLLVKLRQRIEEIGVGTLASITGRYFGLDRDGHWDRTEKAYRAMTESALTTGSLEELITKNYEAGNNDDFLAPVTLGPEAHPISSNDAVIFMDFREDSIRQIAASFVLADFDQFSVKPLSNLFVATMTDYSKKFKVPVLFPNENIEAPLGKALADANKTQMLIAETEKYAHVTYFFNGYRDEPFLNQFKVLIPSRNVARHDEKPEMMADDIGNRIVEAIEDHTFDFIVVNFANPDIIAHTGNIAMAPKAIEAVDKQLGRITKAIEAEDGILLITSDHGNIETMADPYTGRAETSHDANPVPVYLVGSTFKRPKNESEVIVAEHEVVGILADVAPTILEIMGVKKPTSMTGRSLTHFLQ